MNEREKKDGDIMRAGTRLTDDELDQVAGGVSGYGDLNNRNSYKVINSLGATIRNGADHRTKKLGVVSCNTVIKHCGVPHGGTDGSNWVWMPAQHGYPEGYLEAWLLEKM